MSDSLMAEKDVSVAPGVEPFVDRFAELEGVRSEAAWLAAARKAGISRFAEMGFPTRRDEDWRFLSLKEIVETSFDGAWARGDAGLDRSIEIGRLIEDSVHRLTFVDGRFSPSLSTSIQDANGVSVLPLQQAFSDSSLQERAGFGAIASDDYKNSLVSLNTALFEDGAFVSIDAGAKVDRPIELVFVQTDSGANNRVFPRVFVCVEQEAEATIVERWMSCGEGSSLTNGVAEIVVGDRGRLEYIRMLEEAEKTYSLGTASVTLGSESKFDLHSFTFGSHVTRFNIRNKFLGPRSEAVLNGLYMPMGEEVVDHHMVVEHAEPECDSHEYFNGILADQGRGVFHGRIWVHQKGQKTDAKQTNKNLLLSDDAVVNTKPQLEIYADDVKCTHGATLGQLDADALFYCRARGIPENFAKKMLIQAFAAEIVDRVAHEGYRDVLKARVERRLSAMLG